MFRIVLFIISTFIFSACAYNDKEDLKVSIEDVKYIELVWIEHHYHNPTVDYYELKPEKWDQFVKDFTKVKTVWPNNFGSCFEIVIYYKDGSKESFASDGKKIARLKNGKYYKFLIDQNLITKYWGIAERDFCLKGVEHE